MQIVKEKLTKSALFVAIFSLCILIVAIILIGVKQFKFSSQLANLNQVANLSHLLVRQQTSLFSILLMNNAKTEQLKENLDNIAKENFIIDASLYRHNGELLAQSNQPVNLREQLGLTDSTSHPNHQQVVEPIYSNNGIEGFLRVTFDAKYGQTTQKKIDLIFHQLYGEMIVIFLAGILLASSVHYFISHYRRAHRKLKLAETKPKANKPSARSASYHRKRKRVVR